MNWFPSMASHFENGEPEKVVPYFEKIFKIGIFTIAFFAYLLFSLNETFIDVWIGSHSFVGIEIFFFILLNFVVMTLISFTGIIIQASGEFQKMSLLSFIELFTFLVSSYILFYQFGIIGFFVGYILSSMIGLSYSLLLINKILSINILKFITDGTKVLLILFSLMFLIDLVTDLLVQNKILNLLTAGISYAALFLVLSPSYTKINIFIFFPILLTKLKK